MKCSLGCFELDNKIATEVDVPYGTWAKYSVDLTTTKSKVRTTKH